jgi:hypothetical protein
MRYHEALSLGCIPIQQYSESMTGIYEEIENSNGLFFKNEKELSEIVESIKNNECIIKTKKYFLEEYFFNKLYPKIGI